MSSLAHLRRGSGEPLLLLHGIGDRKETFAPIVDRLAERHEVVAVDLPGFGGSPPLRGRPTIEALADAVGDLVRELGLDTPHVAGNSMGGGIALLLGRTGRARTVCGLSPIGFQRGWERRWLDRSLRTTRAFARHGRPFEPVVLRPRGRALLLGQLYAHPDRVPGAHVIGTTRLLAESPGFDATRPATVAFTWTSGDLDVPTTIAWGRKDRLLLPAQANRARAALRRARHVWLEGCGHLPMSDDPEQVARVVLESASG